jgi:hypothetical protein
MQQIEHPIHGLGLDDVFLPVRPLIALGIKSLDAQFDLHQ